MSYNPSFPVAIRLLDPAKPHPTIVDARYEPGTGSASGQLRLEPRNSDPWAFVNLLAYVGTQPINGLPAELGFNDGTGSVDTWEPVELNVTFHGCGGIGLKAEPHERAAWGRITRKAKAILAEKEAV